MRHSADVVTGAIVCSAILEGLITSVVSMGSVLLSNPVVNAVTRGSRVERDFIVTGTTEFIFSLGTGCSGRILMVLGLSTVHSKSFSLLLMSCSILRWSSLTLFLVGALLPHSILGIIIHDSSVRSELKIRHWF